MFDLNDPRYDVDAAIASGNPINVVIAKGAHEYNDVAKYSQAYATMTGNTSDAEAQILANATDPKVLEAIKKRDQLKAQLDKINASLSEWATSQLTAELSIDGQSPEDVKKLHQNASVALRDIVNPMRDMFVMMGLISRHQEEGKRDTFTSNGSELGDDFVKLLNAPGAVASKSGSVANPGQGKRVREWWQANPEGLPAYQKAGKIPTAVKEAYAKANPDDAVSNDDASDSE